MPLVPRTLTMYGNPSEHELDLGWRSAGWAGRDGFRQTGRWRATAG